MKHIIHPRKKVLVQNSAGEFGRHNDFDSVYVPDFLADLESIYALLHASFTFDLVIILPLHSPLFTLLNFLSFFFCS